MKTILTIAFIISAALPIWGALRLYKTAKAETVLIAEKNHGRTDVVTYGGMQNLANGAFAAMLSKPSVVKKDAAIVAAGVIIGALASIASLYV